MREKLQGWLWVAALGFCLLYPSFSKAEDDRCDAATDTRDAASSEKILPPTEAFCKTLKEDIEAIAEFITKNPGPSGEKYIISMMHPVEIVDGMYGPGTHARIVALIKAGYAATDLYAWMNAEYAKCHGIVKPESNSELEKLLRERGEKQT